MIVGLFGSVAICNAQVGINTTAPDAQLDVRALNPAAPANTDGLLIPRVSAFPATNPGAPQNGMLVFLTVTLGPTQPPGYYYWDNATTSWKGVFGTTGWLLTGNAGTSAATHFMGTTDNVDVVFRRFNARAGFLGATRTSFGLNAMNPSATGISNSAFGEYSLASVTTGALNTSVGSNAMFNTTTGANNVAFGTSSLRSNVAGGSNVAIGYEALYSTTTSNTIGIGSGALRANAGATNNLAVGTNALLTNTTAGNNIAIGNAALQNSNANWNVAVGVANLTANTIGLENTAIGDAALTSNSTGSRNTAIGSDALLLNDTGADNVAIGRFTVRMNTAGINNVGVGNNALHNNTTASNNTGVGAGALMNNATGAENTALGTNALTSTSGSYNIGLGVNAGSTLTSGSGNIAIGRGVQLPTATASNQLNIGNVVYGVGMNTLATGRIGIGTTTPTEVLDVAGKTRTTTFQMTTAPAAGRIMTSDAAGNGTWTAPTAASVDFYVLGSTNAPTAITDDVYRSAEIVSSNAGAYSTFPFLLQAYMLQFTAGGDGQASNYNYRTRDSRNDGTGYGFAQTNSASTSYNYWGDNYTFGSIGYCFNDYLRTGGILGANQSGTYWSSLGYKNSGNVAYGVYATSALATGAGRMASSVGNSTSGIGGGFYGNIIGSWSRGTIGQISAGEMIASYNSGDEITSGRQIELVETPLGKKAAFSVTSVAPEVYAKGKIKLVNGTAHVAFTTEYAALLGDTPAVTASPMGECNGLYIASVDKNGFTLKELNNGNSNVTVSWISVGDRIDAKEAKVPADVLASDFDQNLSEVLFNENDLQGKAKGVWQQNGKLQFGEIQQGPSEPKEQPRVKAVSDTK